MTEKDPQTYIALFVGGPFDGRMVEVRVESEHVLAEIVLANIIPRGPHDTVGPGPHRPRFEYRTGDTASEYRRCVLGESQGVTQYFFVHSTLPTSQAIGRLIESYIRFPMGN